MSKIIFRKDVPQTKALEKAARISAKRAFSGSKALGLTITYIKDGVVYEENANGTVVATKQIEKANDVPFEFKKGQILHAK
ncbi:MAG: hypothetical protein ACOVQR_02915 [Flavobacterium sp.]|jgi:hypothetical protein|uniref:hypothetical protein n=1 Tax=Flavobacterium sp. TaxID=239 RepID=UPI003BA7F986